jgi:benzoate 4-monooxygenase
MMPIVTSPILTARQEKFQNLMKGKMNLIELTRQRVAERLATKKLDRQDLLGRLVALRDDKNVTIDMDDIHTAAIEIVIAGSDTSSTTMAMLTYFLAKNPRVYRKLQDEIDSVSKGKHITLEQAKEMKYLQCVIKEALRCFPVVGYHLPRVVPPVTVGVVIG